MLALTRKMIALDPGNPRAFFRQAAMAARARNYDLARKLLQRTGGSMDGVPAVMLLTGVLHYEGGNYTPASERFDRLLSLPPPTTKGRRCLGPAQYHVGNFRAAAQALHPLNHSRDTEQQSRP